MTFFTKLLPIFPNSFVRPAYVRPIKITFFTFRKFINTAILTMISFTKCSSDPVMNSPVGWMFFPKIVGISFVKFLKASFRTKLSFVTDLVCNRNPASRTWNGYNFASSDERARLRTIDVRMLESIDLHDKFLITHRTGLNNTFSFTFMFTRDRAKCLLIPFSSLVCS